jgi:hypothetical protein
MTIITNNVLVGTMDQTGNGPGSGFIPGGITNITIGDPSDVVISPTGSDVVWDSANSQYYMGLVVAGSTWVKLGSIA